MGWKSPVPYLFGGLAAMLGLIAFALLILACSYWKLSGYVDSGADDSSGEGKASDGGEKEKAETVFAHSVLVIVPGEDTPTFLATPAANRATSFGDDSNGGSSSDREGRREKAVELGRTGEERESSGGGSGDDEEEKR